MTTIEQIQENTQETQEAQVQAVPLPIAVENMANHYLQKNEAEKALIEAQREMIAYIQNDPVLRELQERIDLLSLHTKEVSTRYESAVSRAKQSAEHEWRNGAPKTFYGGLLQIRELQDSVIHFDPDKALPFALSVDDKFKASLLKPNKTGFKSLGKLLEVPEDVIQFGTVVTVALTEAEMLKHVSLRVEDIQLPEVDKNDPEIDKNALESDENDSTVD